MLGQVGLADRGPTTGPTRYSRGMRQRLGIADALVKDPEILILDEPTTAIDPIGVVEILDLIRGLARDRGLAILLASHLLDQVQSVCQRVGIFHQGRVIGQGTVEELAVEFGEATHRLEVGVERPIGGRRQALLLGPGVGGDCCEAVPGRRDRGRPGVASVSRRESSTGSRAARSSGSAVAAVARDRAASRGSRRRRRRRSMPGLPAGALRRESRPLARADLPARRRSAGPRSRHDARVQAKAVRPRRPAR